MTALREKWGLTSLSQGGGALDKGAHQPLAAWTERSVPMFRPVHNLRQERA